VHRALTTVGLALTALVSLGCQAAGEPGRSTYDAPAASSTQQAAPLAPAAPAAPAATEPPAWLGTRPLPLRPDGFGEVRPTPRALDPREFTLPDTVRPLPGRGFRSRVRPAPAAVLARSTWEPGCPVAAADLAWVRLSFWGFDDRRHTGELLVARSVADDLVTVFRTLYRQRFPMERLRITPRAELDAAPTGDGNDTGAFVCRPTTGQSSGFSQHAYGLAIDVNPFHNPYLKASPFGDVVLPELASTYLDRAEQRPGMVTPAVVAAFARIGWEWGGAWRSLKDYQHFSQNGR